MSDRALWVRRVSEWKASGQASTTFSAGRGYSASALRYWAKRLEREQPSSAAPVTPVRIARLVRDDLPADAGSTITIDVGRVRVTVGQGFDRDSLRGVLEVLAELGQGGPR